MDHNRRYVWQILIAVRLFCIHDTNKVIDAPTVLPFVELMLQTTGLKGYTVSDCLVHLQRARPRNRHVNSCLLTHMCLCSRWRIAMERFNEACEAPVRRPLNSGSDNWVGCSSPHVLKDRAAGHPILSVSTIALTVSYTTPIVTLQIVSPDKPPHGSTRLG